MASGLLDDYRQMTGLLGDYNAYADSLSPYELAMARAPRGQQEGLLGKVGKALYDTAKRRIDHPVKSYMEDNLGMIMALNPHMPSLWEMNPKMRQAELDTVAMKPGLLGDIAGPVADVNRYAANPDEWTALDTGLAGLGALPFIPALGGIIAGKGAKTADLVKLSKAEKMKAAGKDADTIYKETGWWLDHPDGMPRFEIDDSAMKVNEYPNAPWEAYNSVRRNAMIEDNGALRNMAAQMEPYKDMTLDQLKAEYSRTGKEIVDAAESGNVDLAKKLMKGRRGLDMMLSQMSQKRAGPMSDYVQHGLLSEAYPDVAHMHTRITPNMRDMSGSYNPASPGVVEQIRLQRQPVFNDNLRVPAHEMQHAVSAREGMAGGGTPKAFTKQKEAELARDALNWADELRAKRATMPKADISAVENALTKDYQDMGAMDWLPSREARDLASQPYVLFNDKYPSKQYDDLKNLVSLYGLDKQVSPRSGREIYHNLADESQARLVEQRLGMTPEERQLLPFYHAGSGYGYDVPFDEMILRHGNGPALNLKESDIPKDPSKWYGGKLPNELTGDEFLKLHNTGWIPSDAYTDYEKAGGLGWLGGPKVEPLTELPEKYHVIHDRDKAFIGYANGATARPAFMGQFDTDNEAIQNALRNINEERGVGKSKLEKYPNLVDTYTTKAGKTYEIRKSINNPQDLVVFDGDKPVSLASNEFGAVGVWTEKPHQGQGIGSEILARFLAENPQFRIGQMTYAGEQMTKATHRKLKGLLNDAGPAKSIGKPEYKWFDLGRGKLEVVKNPTPADYSRMNKEVLQEFPDLRPGDIKTRFTIDEDGNRYIWKASDATHAFTEPQIEQWVGKKVNQNFPEPQ